MAKTVLITGVAGFVGAAVAKRMLADGWRVVGVDNLNDYYDVALKEARLADVRAAGGEAFTFEKIDLAERAPLMEVCERARPEVIIHLAAQASVRYGLVNQDAYLNSNLTGHFNVLMAAKAGKEAGWLKHLLYASSSSVYGNMLAEGGSEQVCREDAKVDKPVSLYAATKVADEVLSHAWQVQFGVPCTGLRFFTVYGPWGRPDMSPMLFAKKILAGEAIPLFNAGDLWRDFTFVDDVVEAIAGLVKRGGQAEAEVFNIGNQNPVRMTEFVETLAEVLGVEAKVDNLPWPPTEVYRTCADTGKLKGAIGWVPETKLRDGLAAMAGWYQEHYGS